MSYSEWLQEYSIGIDEIDEQHKYLLSLISQLDRIEAEGEPRHLHRILEELKDYAAFHFGAEEELMHTTSIPTDHLYQHISAHRAYLREVSRWDEQVDSGDHAMLSTLHDFLRHWWVDHICGMDREMGHLLLASTKAG